MQESQTQDQTVQEAVEKIQEVMRGPMEYYNSARTENEIDLIEEVRQRMIGSGLLEKIEHYDNNRFIQEAKGRPAHAQQYNLNRFFTMQFMACEGSTDVQRYALIYEVRPDQWLEIFDKTILPAVVDFGLPVAI